MNYFVYNGVRSTDMGVRIMSKNPCVMHRDFYVIKDLQGFRLV